MFDFYKKIDFTILISLCGLLVLGLLALYSTSHTALGDRASGDYFVKQTIWTILGFFLIFILYFVPNRWIFASSYYLYFISLLMLVLVIFMGKVGQGAERWLQIGPISVQPSEFVKLTTILAVARFISKDEIDEMVDEWVESESE